MPDCVITCDESDKMTDKIKCNNSNYLKEEGFYHIEEGILFKNHLPFIKIDSWTEKEIKGTMISENKYIHGQECIVYIHVPQNISQ